MKQNTLNLLPIYGLIHITLFRFSSKCFIHVAAWLLNVYCKSLVMISYGINKRNINTRRHAAPKYSSGDTRPSDNEAPEFSVDCGAGCGRGEFSKWLSLFNDALPSTEVVSRMEEGTRIGNWKYSGTSVYVRFVLSPTWYTSCLDGKNFAWYTTFVWNTTRVLELV
jgi:hypothetical protein